MAVFDWKPFLEQWSRVILASPDVEYFDLPPEVIESGWLGYSPATDAQIAAAETRLGVTLPPSYKAFLKVTNGWWHAGGSIERILPVEEIDWLREKHPDLIEAWTMFGPGDYDPAYDPVDLRDMPDTLAVSDIGDGAILLLNPAVRAPDGEWENWFFADWLPGAQGFDSFQEMLHDQYESVLRISREEAQRLRPDEPAEAVIVKLPDLIARLEEKAAGYRRLAEKAGLGGEDYHRGIIAGLETVIARVRAVQATDPQALHEQLRAVAAELDAETAQAQADMQAAINPEDLLGPLLSPAEYSLTDMLNRIMDMAGSIHKGGEVEGKREGAAIIWWFLNEG
jgi:hypothetical protein